MNNPKRKAGFLSVILVVADVLEAEKFYCTAFDLLTDYRIRDKKEPISATLSGENVQILLSKEDPHHRTLSPRNAFSNSVTMVRWVDDTDKAAELFLAAGGKILSGPKYRYWGAYSVLVEDPDGHRWMIQTQIKIPAEEEMIAALEPLQYQKNQI
ncbi:VOC family protein [candidate division KSB1 bacterium]|nr:VOC family protein [candidate division KSB1 bacterium]